MNYFIGKPPHLKYPILASIAGNNPALDTIYLYGNGGITEFEDFEWTMILQHEHLHNLFRKLQISIHLHHAIIDKIEKFLYDKNLIV